MRKSLDNRLLFRFVSVALFTLVFVAVFLRSHNVRQDHQTVATPDVAPQVEKAPGAITNDLQQPNTLQSDQGNALSGVGANSVPVSQNGAVQNPQLHVVVAHHTEEPYYIRMWTDNLRSVPYVQELGVKVIIYTKGPETDLAALKETSGAEEVHRLPNVGREGGTYLHHLLNVYDNPPRFVMFTQSYIKKAQQEKGEHTGAMKNWLYDRLMTTFGSDTGFMSLDRKHDICYCGHCTDMGRDDFYPLWPQIFTMLQGMVCQELEGHVLSFNGHFIVSKRRITARSKSIYEYLKGLVNAPEDHWIHTEPKPEWFEKKIGKSTPSNPKFGHTLERLWHTLFNCSDPSDMTDCDLSGMKAEGPGGCTCKDFPFPAN